MAEPGPENQDKKGGSLSKTVVKGASLSGLGYFLAQAITLGAYLALARLATPSDFGDFAAGSVVVGLALMVSDSGMMAALVQRRDRVEEAAATAVISTFAAGLGFALLALAVSPLVGVFFDSSEVGAIAAAMSGIVLLRSMGAIPSAMLQRRFSFLRRTVVEPISALAFGAAAVIATSNDMGAWGLVIGQYAFAVTEVGLTWGVGRWRPQLRLANMGMWRELVGYGRHVLVASIIGRVGEQADTIWLGRFIGTATLGQYRYALRLATTPFQALMAAASFVLFPAFSRVAEDNIERFESAFMRSLRWFCVIAFPAGMIMIPLGEPLAVFLFGDVWRQAGEATAYMCLFCGGSALGSMAGEALKAHGTTRKLTTMHTFTTLATAALMGALLPFGLNGVAAGLSAGAVVGGLFSLRVAHRAIGFSFRDMWAQIWPPLVASTVMAGLMFAIASGFDPDDSGLSAFLVLLGEGLIAFAIYCVVLRMFVPSLMDELEGPLASAWAKVGSGGTDTAGPPDAMPAPGDATASFRSLPALGPSTDLPDLPPAAAPRFSVVMAAYDAEETIGSAIESVLAQTERDLELIVVDDGSTDRTAEIAESYAGDGTVFVFRQQNAGPSAARNRGIRFARGRYVSFLDSDDMLMPTYLDEMSAALESDPRNGMAFTDGWSFDHNRKKIHVSSAMSTSATPDHPPTDSEELLRMLVHKNFMLSAAMVRREVLVEVGGYDETMRYAEDYDLWLRIVMAGYLVGRGPGRLVIQRERSDSLSKDDAEMLTALRDLLARIADDPNIAPSVREVARERSAFWGRQAAAETGESAGRAALLRARRTAGRAKRRVRARPAYDDPPAEVAAAFPDLESR